jgi:ADP-heptose:LPS heptosyltransferase
MSEPGNTGAVTGETPSPPRRILLCRSDRLGDVILSLPCAVLLKRMFPGCRILFLARSYPAPVIYMLSQVDDVIEWDPDEDADRLADGLRDRDLDAAVMLHPEHNLAKILKAAAIPLRAGIAYRWYSRLFTYRHREHRKHNLKHEVEYNLSLTFATFSKTGRWEDFLPPGDIFPLDLEIPAGAVERVRALLSEATTAWEEMDPRRETIVVLHPGGGGSAYRWKVERFAQLAKRLADGNLGILVTGAEAEREWCGMVAGSAGGKAVNLCGELSLPELAALLRFVGLFITNSTGPLHLCRAVGGNALGLFPSDPAMSPVRWGLYGQPDRVLTPPKGKSMDAISVETVYQRAMKILRRV